MGNALSLFGLLILLKCLTPIDAHKSMPYSLQTHSTALGGKSWLRGLAPNSAILLRLSLSQRRNVSRLTPAASANSYLYIAFMLQRY